VQQVAARRWRIDAEQPNGLGVDDLDDILLIHHHDADGRIELPKGDQIADTRQNLTACH
jgi:hypothetical protein